MRLPDGEQGGRRVEAQVQGLDIVPTILDYLNIPQDHGLQGKTLLPLAKGEKGAEWTEYAFTDRIPWWEHTLSRWYLEFKNSQTEYPDSEKAPIAAYGKMLKSAFPQNSYPPGDIAVRTNKWKLIIRKAPRLLEEVSWYGFITGTPLKYGEVELYDIVNDPWMKVNVASANPAIVDDLKKRLLAWDDSVEKRKAVYGAGEKRFIIPYP